jgi:hypothetical protein
MPTITLAQIRTNVLTLIVTFPKRRSSFLPGVFSSIHMVTSSDPANGDLHSAVSSGILLGPQSSKG